MTAAELISRAKRFCRAEHDGIVVYGDGLVRGSDEMAYTVARHVAGCLVDGRCQLTAEQATEAIEYLRDDQDAMAQVVRRLGLDRLEDSDDELDLPGGAW